jgi:hypothetical protein
MSSRRLNDITVLAVAGIAMVVLTIAGALIAPPPAGDEERGSTFSPGPDGAKAAYLTLKQLGYRIDRSVEPLTAVTVDPSTAVLVLASPSEPPSDQDRRALRRFLEAGGVVLATGTGGAEFLSGKVDDKTAGEPSPSPTSYSATLPSPLTAGAPRITMVPEAESVRFDPPYISIYGPEESGVVRTSLVGDGRAIWWAGSTPLSNDAVSDAGNLDLLINVLELGSPKRSAMEREGEPGAPKRSAMGREGGRAILWDEHYHGHTRSMWSYAAATPLLWVLTQLGVIAATALATYSRRRGPVRPKVIDSRTSPMEFVDTLGGLYEQARAAAASVRAALVRLRRLLLTASGLPAGSSIDAVSRTAAARFGLAEQDVHDVLVKAEHAAANPSLDPAEALVLVKRLQTLAAIVTRTRGASRSF